jgi:cyclopropane fatty-acyl-phospholipid synthase-like methyltransferase
MAAGWRDPVDFYAAHAAAFDAERSRALNEAGWLEAFSALLPPGGTVLDMGCGMGEPMAAWLIERGYCVTGVDATAALLDLAQARFPEAEWVKADMRGLDLGRRFDGILAWDSFFHLSVAEQCACFSTFAAHAVPGAPLMFTSGAEHGEIANPLYGEPLYHASMTTDDYRALLDVHGFQVARHVVADPACGERTIWLARSHD